MVTPGRLVILFMALTLVGSAFLFVGAPTPVPDVSPSPLPSASPSAGVARTLVLASDGTGDAATLVEALRLARDGDTIVARPGTYDAPSWALRVHDVRLAGEGPRDAIVLRVTMGSLDRPRPDGGGGTYHAGLFLADSSPTISGLTIRMEDPGYPAVTVVGPETSALLRDVVIEGSVHIVDGASPRIEASEVRGGDAVNDRAVAAAISIGAPYGLPPTASIHDTTIRGGQVGIAIGDGATLTLTGSDVSASDAAILATDAGGTIADNRLHDSGTGIVVAATSRVLQDPNDPAAEPRPAPAPPLVERNAISGNGTGVSLEGCARPALVGNVVESNGVGLHVADCVTIGTPEPAEAWRVEGNRVCANTLDVDADPGAGLPADATEPCGGASAPPAPSAAPAALEPPVTLTFETVRPGVERVRAWQGDRELLGDIYGPEISEVEVGPDGTVWLLGTGGVARVGGPGFSSPGDRGHGLTIGADGTAWVVTGAEQAASFDGASWTTVAPPERGRVRAIETPPDGSVWVLWTGGDGRPSLAHLDDGTWTTLPDPVGPGVPAHGAGLAVTGDGDAWLGGSAHHTHEFADRWRGLARFAGESWSSVRPVDPDLDLEAGPLVAGADGSLWVYVTGCELDGRLTMSEASRCADDRATYRWWLARYDGSAWRTFTAADGIPMLEGFQTWGSAMAVAPDGTLWVGYTGGGEMGGQPDACGLLSIDGAQVRQHLPGECVDDLAVGPDGTAWAHTLGDPTGPVLYRVTPQG
jgi:hypothetical protein